MPGDHLQSFYWFWLFSDNLWGASSLLTNPYEFNGPSGPMSAVYANFPFSILYVFLLPLGPIGAYNGLILLSFLLSGVSAFLLTSTWTKDPWAATLSGLIFAVVPYRVSHIAGGQLFGYVIFLLPLALYFLEMNLVKRNWIYGWIAGICLILMSLMEPHASFLTALTIGVYLPSRLLLFQPAPSVENRPEKYEPLWPGLIGVILGGLSFSCFLWIKIGSKTGLPFWHSGLIQNLILGMITVLLIWFFLSALLARLTTFSFIQARNRLGKAFLFFLPLALYALKYKTAIPRLGLILPLISAGLFIPYLLRLGIKHREHRLGFDRPMIIGLLFAVGTGLTLASAYLLHMRKTVLLPSIAGKGRTIQEVLLFSPRLPNLFFWQDINQERFVILGWGLLILACLGLIPLFRNKARNQERLALAGLLAFGAVILTLGPTLTNFPVYEILYHYLPFFNYPRVPGRFVMVGFIFLGLLAAHSLASFRQWLAAKGRNRLGRWIPLLIIPLVLAEYHTYQPLGISLLTGHNRIYSAIQDHLPKGSLLLELPIWPGDSHQSSAYEYTVTRTRRPMINGYAPVVVRDYISKVFWPLYPLDQGELGETQRDLLKRLKADLITFHDNYQIYSEKVSPFPPRLALKRLMASPFLKLIDQDKDVYIFKLQIPSHSESGKEHTPSPLFRETASQITSPLSAIYYVHNLPLETGSYQWDSSASGYYLLMDEQGLKKGRLIPRPGMKGNVVKALSGRDRPGYLTLGAHRFFPSGKYRAIFRLKSGIPESGGEIGRLEILGRRTNLIAERVLKSDDFKNPKVWTDIPVEFETSSTGEVGFRVYFSGRASLQLNTVLIGFADQKPGPGQVEAEDLLRQTGTVVPDEQASNKEAVLGKAGFHPPIYLSYGPYRTFEPGKYTAAFFLRLASHPTLPPGTEVALLEIATDLGKRVLASRIVSIEDLKIRNYRTIEVGFEVPFRCELGYRVKFAGKADLLVDRIAIQ